MIRRINAQELTIKENNQILFFDASDDDVITGNLVIKTDSSRQDHTLLLPFKTTSIESSLKLLSSAGQYDNYTLINYKVSSICLNSIVDIPFRPIYETPDLTDIQIEEVNGLYFYKSGLDRKIVYVDENNGKVFQNHKDIKFDTIKLVAFKLPIKSQRFVRNKKNTSEISDPILEDDIYKYYKFDSLRKVSISYRVPLNKTQEKLGELLVKLLATVCPLLIAAIALKAGPNLNSRQKKRIIYICTCITIAIFLGIIYFAYFLSAIPSDKIVDSLNLGLTLVVTIWFHRKSGS